MRSRREKCEYKQDFAEISRPKEPNYFSDWCSQTGFRYLPKPIKRRRAMKSTDSRFALIAFAAYFVRYLWWGISRSINSPGDLYGFSTLSTALVAFLLVFRIWRDLEIKDVHFKIGALLSVAWGVDWMCWMHSSHYLATMLTELLKMTSNPLKLLAVAPRILMALAAFYLAFNLWKKKPYLDGLLFISILFAFDEGRLGMTNMGYWFAEPSNNPFDPEYSLSMLLQISRVVFAISTVIAAIIISYSKKQTITTHHRLIVVPLILYGAISITRITHSLTTYYIPDMMYKITTNLPLGLAIFALAFRITKMQRL